MAATCHSGIVRTGPAVGIPPSSSFTAPPAVVVVTVSAGGCKAALRDAEGSSLLDLLLTGESADDQYTARLGCSRIVSGERRIPPKDREDISVNQDLIENIRLFRFSNKNSIVQSLKTLFQLNQNLITIDESAFIKDLESDEYLTKVLRIAVKNSDQSGKKQKLTEEEKAYLDSIYAHVSYLSVAPLPALPPLTGNPFGRQESIGAFSVKEKRAASPAYTSVNLCFPRPIKGGCSSAHEHLCTASNRI